MNIKRTWVVASATIAIAGFAGAGIAMASDDVELKDPQHAPVVQLHADQADSAGGSADSPGTGSADSAADSPGEAVPAKPAAAPVVAPPVVIADSGDSPAPAPVRPPVHSGDSGNSGASADSAG